MFEQTVKVCQYQLVLVYVVVLRQTVLQKHTFGFGDDGGLREVEGKGVTGPILTSFLSLHLRHYD
jgi:hypothetical protein